MGSPVRVSGYDGTESMADGNHDGTDTYLTYGYDEFGNDPARTIGRELEEAGIPSPYTMQGEGQPFGYTGYRYDTDSGTYFAQAREYQPQSGRFHAQDAHWNIENSIYGDTIQNNHIPDIHAIRQSQNLYGYCMNNPVRYVDMNGAEAGDKFKSRDKAAMDFAETTNGISIEENLEYGAYIYSWKEETKFLFIPITKTYYSYTEPFTDNMEGHLDVTSNPSLPDGAIWEAVIHTHGAWKTPNEGLEKWGYLNDRFSDGDILKAEELGKPLYLISPNGQLRVYYPDVKNPLDKEELIGGAWKYPHDRNHPDLPKYHWKNCSKCFEEE